MAKSWCDDAGKDVTIHYIEVTVDVLLFYNFIDLQQHLSKEITKTDSTNPWRVAFAKVMDDK
jgi:hypothetical protein